MLKNPRVNSEIWSNLSQNTQQQDLQLAKTQSKLAKMLTLNAQLTAGLTELRLKLKGEDKKSTKTLAKTALEIAQIGAVTMQELSQIRRQKMRFDMQHSYQTLCKRPKEESEQLFGDDLVEKVKDLKEVKNIGAQVTKQPFLGKDRYKPYDSRKQQRQEYGQSRRSDYKSDYKSGYKSDYKKPQYKSERPPWRPTSGTSKGNKPHRR
jgi:hypothetical protein